MAVRKVPIIIAFIIAAYLDTVFFKILGIASFAPDMLIALILPLGIVVGGIPAALTGIALGIIIDITANIGIGSSSVFFCLAALCGGFFHEKFYADNWLVPAAAAAIVVLVRELIVFAVCRLTGRNMVGFFSLMLTHILPCAALTGAAGALCYLFIKHKCTKNIY